ncbi:MAG: outer membrane beta-barrel protein [Myxococcota bacterium]
MRRAITSIRNLIMALGLVTLAATAAFADGDSIVTLGVGGGIGIHKAGAPGGDASTAFVNQANIRLKLLYFLGLDYAYDLSHDAKLSKPSEALQFQAKMRLTALLYPYSGEHVAFYLGAGIGGTRMSEMMGIGGEGNSYHAGLGFEFHIASHLSIDMSFMVVAPGVKSVERAAVAEIAAAYAEGGADAVQQLQQPGISDFLSLKNHEFLIRFFLFL